jgi:putative membrane protein
VSLDASYQGKLDKLKGLQLGGDFDEAYDRMQVEALKEAVSLFERYSKGGDNKALKEFAEQTLPELQRNLLLANDLRK